MPMNSRLLRPRASGFDPRTISNLRMWFDATDASTITTVSGAVSAWNSKVGGITSSQSTANNRPAYLATGMNGKPAVDFDGSNDFLTTTYNANLITGYVTYAAAVIPDSPSAASAILGARGSTANGGPVRSTDATARWTLSHRDMAVTYANASGGLIQNVNQVVLTTINATALTVRVNGSQSTVTSTFAAGSNETNAVFNIARDATPTPRFFNGTFGEILMYDRTLTASELLSIERYLARKWGVTL